jgi:hypothetical protein
LFPVIVTVSGLSVPDASPDQPVNSNPVEGVAVTTTVEFSLCVPLEGSTFPPSEAETDKVYVTVGVSGVGLSFEQANRIKKIQRINFFICLGY